MDGSQQNHKFHDCSFAVIGCAMNVHGALGCGFQEMIYGNALDIELRHAGLTFEREKEMAIFYRGQHIGRRRVDFCIQHNFMVELKAMTELQPVHMAQAINYLEAFNAPAGLLINFGAPKLEFRRLYNNRFQPFIAK